MQRINFNELNKFFFRHTAQILKSLIQRVRQQVRLMIVPVYTFCIFLFYLLLQ